MRWKFEGAVMNFYMHHIGDYVKKTSHLSPAALGVYQRFVDWCYAHEKPLPLRMRDLYEIAHAFTPTDRRSVDRVLADFFEMTDKGFEQAVISRNVAKYAEKTPEREAKKLSVAERQQRYRDKRSQLFATLRASGISAAYDSRNGDLEQLVIENGLTLMTIEQVNITRGVTRNVTLNVPVGIQNPISNRGVTRGVTPSAVTVSESLGFFAKIARAAGISAVNPSDPRLAQLIDEGLTPVEMQLTAAECAAQGKGWPYLLATIKGRKGDAARQQGPRGDGKTYKQRAIEAKQREWFPEMYQDQQPPEALP